MARPGPEFWKATFGVESYEQFAESLRDWWPESLGYIVHLDREQMLHIAWEDPLSSFSAYAAGILSVRGLADVDVPKTTAASAGFAAWTNLLQSAGNMITGATMPQLIIPNTYLVSIEGVSGTQPVVNVIGVSGTAGLATEVAQAVLDAWKAPGSALSQHAGQYVMEQVRAMDLSSSNGEIGIVGDTTAGGRGTATPLATNAACALVKWNGGTRSRSSRGRLYHGPLTEGDINSDGRTMSTSNRALIETAYETFRSELTEAGHPLVVISRTLSQTFPVSGVSVESVIATQRRRIRA